MRGNKYMNTDEDAPLVQNSSDRNQRGARQSTPDPWHKELQNIVDLPKNPDDTVRQLSPGRGAAMSVFEGLKLI